MVDSIAQRNLFERFVDRTKNTLDTVANFTDSVRVEFNAINTSINDSIDLFIDQPLSLAFQAIQLVQAPGRAAADIRARLDAYGNLFNSFVSGADDEPTTFESVGDFSTNEIFASSCVTGSIISSLNNVFTTRTEAIETSESILSQMSDLVQWRDDNFEIVETIDTGESYQALQEAVALAVGYLVELSFSLQQERRVTLDRDRTIVDLSAELYGEVDSRLDFFINSNNLTGSEILELPAGKEIVYFV